MVTRARGLLAGVASAALLAVFGAPEIVSANGGARTISLYNIHTKETVSVVYKKDGKYVDAGLEKVNHVLRDHRRNEATKMDPVLVDLLWEMHAELGSKEPIHIISGYRSRASNELLRRTVGGQASESRHIYGKAADVHFPDVPLKNLRYSALVREKGGVGYYPTSAIPFVHVDTDTVRSWPRLPRYELALLFPSGQTRHAAAEGGPISKEDVKVAQAKFPALAVQVAEFRVPSASQRQPQVAMVSPPQPIAAARPSTPAVPSRADRDKLAELISLSSAPEPQLIRGPTPARRPQPAMASLSGGPIATPSPAPVAPQPAGPKLAAIDPSLPAGGPLTDATRAGWGSAAWVPAPAYDEEHPEELSYRPFPIAPYLTQTASEPLMSELVAHDVARTVEFIDQAQSVVPLRFRPGEQVVRQLWAQQFTGGAIGIDKLREAQAPVPHGLESRPVRTTQRN